ncbi:g7293 [Coccomyxa elongata]
MSLVLPRSLLLKGVACRLTPRGGSFQGQIHLLERRCYSLKRRSVASRAIAGADVQIGGQQDVEASFSGIDWNTFDEYQRSVPRLSHAEQARLLLDTGRHGVLSTIGSFGAWKGFPVGTVVEYAMDDTGRPLFAFSSLSSHTPDIKADPRCSLTVTAPGYQGMSDARVTISGTVCLLEDGDVADAKKVFLQKNPGSFWVEFGDFQWFRMDNIATARLVGGFGRIKQISSEEYLSTHRDPVAAFAQPIASHMNADHADSIMAMAKHYAGIVVHEAKIVGLDRLGLDLQCQSDGKSFSCRLPFIRPAENRKDIKDIIVEMTRTAAGKA